MKITTRNKLLVVDDKANNLNLATSLLRPQYDVYLANNGEKAVTMAQELRPHLILLDVMMPGLSGFQVCELLKRNEATTNIPIIFLTARNSGEDYEKAYELGGVDYITKPINAKELLARVNTHLIIREQNEQLETQNRQIANMNNTLENEVINRTAELMDAIDKLEKRNLELEEASYVISHNLRGPVASIMGLCQIYDENGTISENKTIVNHLFESCKKLDEITKELLEIVSFRESEIPPFDNVCLRAILDEVIEKLEGRENIIVEFDFDDNLMIYTAYALLKEIFQHLLSNAVKFQSEVQPKINIRAKKQKGLIRIEIKDNGLGIDQKHISDVFFPFKRFTFDKAGKGLGLYKVKHLIDALKGEVYLESKVGNGTKVSVVLFEDEENQ